jgi:hypothetical protein
MDIECFESPKLWEESKHKLTIFPLSSLFIHGKMLITTHLNQISYPVHSK